MAVNHVLYVGWNRPVAGKETAAVEHLNQFISYLGKLQSMGNIESYEPVILDHHGGDMNGFVLIRGDRARLAAMQASEEWIDQIVRAGILVTHLGEIYGYVNDGLRARLSRYARMAR